MDTELTPEEKSNAEDGERIVWRGLSEGRTHGAIIADLMRLDWTYAAAAALIERVASDRRRHQDSPESRAALVQECRKQMFCGFALAILGAVGTAFSAIAALAGVHIWIIFGGVMVTGLVIGSRGLARWRLCRRDSF